MIILNSLSMIKYKRFHNRFLKKRDFYKFNTNSNSSLKKYLISLKVKDIANFPDN